MTQNTIIHEKENKRFILQDSANVAELTYELNNDTITFNRTYVPPVFEGQGIGSKLVKAGFEYADKENLKIKSTCSFVSAKLLRRSQTSTMIKIYGMETCPDCTILKTQIEGNDKYEVIDIGQNVRHLKAFLKLRDNNPIFDEVKKIGAIGIPCFVLADGTVTLNLKDAGLQQPYSNEKTSCNIDGSGC